MKKMILTLKMLSFGLIASFLLTISPVTAAEVGLMSIDELKQSLNDENLVILDVRTGRDWSSSEFKITGAVRAAPPDFDQWVSTLDKDKTLVLYCA